MIELRAECGAPLVQLAEMNRSLGVKKHWVDEAFSRPNWGSRIRSGTGMSFRDVLHVPSNG